MCSKMCRKTDAGAGGSALPQAAVALWAAHFYYNYMRLAEDRGDKAKADVPSGLTDFVSATTPPTNPENSAFCPSCGAECVAKCGANPAGGPA